MRRVLAATAFLALLVLAWLPRMDEPRHAARTTRPVREAEVDTPPPPGPGEFDAETTIETGGTSTTPVPERTWRVRLVTNSDRPIPGVTVRFVDGDDVCRARSVTGEDGWAECATIGDVRRIVAPPFVDSTRVRERQTVVRLEVLPLEVVLRDVSTGAVLSGGQVELTGEGYRRSVPRDGDRFRTSLAPVVPERSVSFRLRVFAPESRSGPTDVVVRENVSRMAARMRVEVPIGPEIRQRLRVVDDSDHPVEGARAEVGVQVGESTHPLPFFAEPSDCMGGIELRRLPYSHRQLLVVVTSGGVSGVGSFRRGMEDPVVVRLVADERRECKLRADADEREDPEGENDEYGPPPSGSHRLEVKCVRARGDAAAGVRVRLLGETWGATALADARGIAVFEGIAAIECSAVVCDSAFRSPTVPVDPSTEYVVVQELPGRLLTVRLRDRGGRSVPLLQLLPQPELASTRVVDRAEVAGIFTDLNGVAHLIDVPISAFEIETERGRIHVPPDVDSHEATLPW